MNPYPQKHSILLSCLIALFLLPAMGIAQPTLELVKDLIPGDQSSSPEGLTVFKNKVYFVAQTSNTGFVKSLCASDGTPGGTELILSTSLDSFGLLYESPIVVGNYLYFFTKTATGKFFVWESDGTAAGTASFYNQSAVPGSITAFKGKLWLATGKNIQYLDLSQHTLVDFHTAESTLEKLRTGGDYLYWLSLHPIDPFSSQLQLYRSDGQAGNIEFLETLGDTYSSTSGSSHVETNFQYENGHFCWNSLQVSNANGGTYFGGVKAGMDDTTLFVVTGSMCIHATAVTDSAYFVYTSDGYSNSTAPDNWQLWSAPPGSTSFQRIMADTAQIKSGSVPLYPLLSATPGRIFFIMWKTETGAELGVSDGTAAGTRIVKDINPGAFQSSIQNPTLCGDKLIFSAFDGVEYAVWCSDGTEGGTQKLAPLPSGYHFLVTQRFMIAGDALFLSIFTDATGTELWKLSPLPCSAVSQTELPQNGPDFRLYPNPGMPGSTHLMLADNLQAPFRIGLAAMTGNTLWQQVQNGIPVPDLEIPTGGLPAGVYFVTLTKDGKSETKKLVLIK